MYIHIEQKMKCSKCGAVDQTESVTRTEFTGSKRYIRCTNCGHEKLMWEETHTHSDKTSWYYAKPQDEEEIF